MELVEEKKKVDLIEDEDVSAGDQESREEEEEKEDNVTFNITCNMLGSHNALMMEKLVETEDKSELLSKRMLVLV